MHIKVMVFFRSPRQYAPYNLEHPKTDHSSDSLLVPRQLWELLKVIPRQFASKTTFSNMHVGVPECVDTVALQHHGMALRATCLAQGICSQHPPGSSPVVQLAKRSRQAHGARNRTEH